VTERAVMRTVIRRTADLARAEKAWKGAIRSALREHHSVRAVARVAGVSASTVQRIAGKQP
jgi:transposase-like protein